LGQAHATEYVALIERCRAENQAFWKIEKRVFQKNHAQIGELLLSRWNFPERVVAAIAWHHESAACPRPHRRLAALTNLGNVLAYRIGRGYGYRTTWLIQTPHPRIFLVCAAAEFDDFEESVKDALAREQDRFR
jgi:HD-like signal output (HDOD) protein